MVAPMFQDLNRVLDQVSRDKGIPKEYIIEAIEAAFLSAARKKWGHLGELEAQFNDESGEIELFQFKTIVENIEDENIEMSVEDGKELDPDAEIGDSLGVKMDPSVFGRIAAQTAKQVIIQKVRDAEREIVYAEYKDRLGELVTGIVRRLERGEMIVDLGRTEAVVPRDQQVASERYRPGERLQGLFVKVDKEGKGPVVMLSRKSSDLVSGLFAMEVPEIAEGIVELRAVAREAGVRSKIAVFSRDSDIDPVGACVGMKGSRVQNVVAELKGEKIDIVNWDEDPARFVCNAIAPAEVSRVIIREREHSMEVVVPDDQLSLAIGRRGQNVRLAAQLTEWNIDVYSESKIDAKISRERKVLSKILEIEDADAIVLYSHSFRNFEGIAEASEEEFFEVPGIGEDDLRAMQVRAKQAIAEGIKSAELLTKLQQEEEEERRKQEEVAAAKQAEETAAAEAEAAAQVAAAELNASEDETLADSEQLPEQDESEKEAEQDESEKEAEQDENEKETAS